MEKGDNMSRKCFDFICSSFLGDKNSLSSCFSRYNDDEIRNELKKYRQYVLTNIEEIYGEINNDKDSLNISLDSSEQLPTEDVYRQLLLYMDQVIIPDPLFQYTEEHTQITKASACLLGLTPSDRINKEDLCNAIKYVFEIEALIISGIVVMAPVSLFHEQPQKIPIRYSPSAFADVIPEAILEYYRSIAKVYNLVPKDGKIKVIMEKPLELGTRIMVEFTDNDCCGKSIFQYYHIKNGEKNNMIFIPAESITNKEFDAWVNQSINQASNSHFNEVYQELILSAKCGCMYLTRSNIISNVLKKAITKPSKQAELATVALSLDLPIASTIPIEDLISIRQNYGQAFHNFRTELNSKLLTLNMNSDYDELKRQVDNISYEMNTIQVQEIEKEYRKIAKTLKIDALGVTGSLIANFTTGGLTALGAAATFVKGVFDANKYYTNVHEHNGFFLWKLKKRAEKYTT